MTTSRSCSTLGSRVRTTFASLNRGVCFSRKQPSASSQWNVPLCVPIRTIARLLEVCTAADMQMWLRTAAAVCRHRPADADCLGCAIDNAALADAARKASIN
jgi:hypothetical protein